MMGRPPSAAAASAVCQPRFRSVPQLARECVVNADNLVTIPERVLSRRRGALGPEELAGLDEALRIALDLD